MKDDPRVRQEWARRVGEEGSERRPEPLAVEEPLEIRLVFGPPGRRLEQSVAVAMRTPGNDVELALGFLRTEGILARLEDLESAAPGSDLAAEAFGEEARPPACNTVRVQLGPGVRFDLARLQRNVYTTSSCGVCSKASLEALKITGCRPLDQPFPGIAAETVRLLPERLLQAQSVFAATGGLHAAGLFSCSGQLLSLREDVGRHNAVDKVVGEQFLAGRLPLSERILMVSGRSSFEILQKALAAGIPLVAAVGAPSSLAVEVARQYRMTLLGFVRDGRFNIYCGEERVRF